MLALPAAPASPEAAPTATIIANALGHGSLAVAAGGSSYIALNLREKLDYAVIPEFRIASVISIDFIAPPGFPTAEMALDEGAEGVFVVHGRPGSGRETVAIRLLAAGRPGKIEMIQPDWDVKITPADLRCHPDARYLLDVTSAEIPVTRAWAETLHQHSKNLANAGAQLVVIMTSRQYGATCDQLRNALRVEPPKASRLLRKQLAAHQRAQGGEDRQNWLNDEPLLQLLDTMDKSPTPPSDVVNLAQTLIETERRDLKNAVEQFRKWPQFLAEQLRAEEKGAARRRALLIAAATLDTFTVLQVLTAKRLLLDRLGIVISPVEALESEGVGTRFEKIHAEIADDCVYLDAGRPGVCFAVLNFIWADHHDLRVPLLDWLKVLLNKMRSAKIRERVAMLLICLTVSNTSKDLISELFSWLRAEGETRRVAMSCLDALLVDPTMGSTTQAQLYRLATSESTETLPHLAELCAGSLAHLHLPRALVRLRPLAAKAQTDEHQLAVRSAARRIAENPTLRIALLTQAIDWSQTAKTRTVGKGFLQALVDPDGSDEVVSLLLAQAADDDTALFPLQLAWLELLDEPHDEAVGQMAAAWCLRVEQNSFDRRTVQEVFGPVTHHISGTPKLISFTNWMTNSIKADIFDWLKSSMPATQMK